MNNTYRKRNLTFVNIEDKIIGICCDSSGSIGEKEYDVLKVDPYFVGAFTARVGLIELLSLDGKILAISNGICNEMEPTGKRILEGIQGEVKKLGLANLSITGSTEENFASSMTGIGLTVVGLINKDKLNFEKIVDGDIVALCGIPKVGEEISLDGDKDLVTYGDINNLINWKGTKDIIPCGSKGVSYKCNLYNDKLTFIRNNTKINLEKSCGPATCCVVIIKKEYKNNIIKTDAPFNIIGEYKMI